jgi:hypothetical protein
MIGHVFFCTFLALVQMAVTHCRVLIEIIQRLRFSTLEALFDHFHRIT